MAEHKFKTIVFHIGPHKTGTTFLQHQLRMAHDALLEAGWTLPTKLAPDAPDVVNHGMLFRALLDVETPSFRVERGWEGRDVKAMFRVWLAESKAPNLLISAEHASQIRSHDWRKTRDFFAPYMDSETEVRIIGYVRHPLRQALSYRNQAMKEGLPWNEREQMMVLRRHQERRRDVEEVWGGQGRCEVYSYEGAVEEGIWPHFLGTLGGLDPAAFPLARSPKHAGNPSASLEAVWILAGRKPATPAQFQAMLKVGRLPGSKDGFSPEVAEALWAEVGSPTNAWLAELGLPTYDKDLPLADVKSPDLWPEDFLEGFTALWEEVDDDVRAFLRVGLVGLAQRNRFSALHPDARARLKGLLDAADVAPETWRMWANRRWVEFFAR